MSDFYEKIKNSKEIPENYKYYWGYQYKLSKEILVPYLRERGYFESGSSAVEIGSAEGGALAAFAEAGARKTLALDIAKNRLKEGEKIAKIGGLNIEFSYFDVLRDEVEKRRAEQYDLAILRDAIEHLEDPSGALKRAGRFLKPKGILFVQFPPYYSPFGGHQHTAGNLAGKTPYAHLLPDFLFKFFVKGGRKADAEEIFRLRKIKLTPKKFERAAEQAGFEIVERDFYVLRPVFKMKFGLPSLKFNALRFFPPALNLFCMEADYFLRKKDGQ